jgi:hypothetical protein
MGCFTNSALGCLDEALPYVKDWALKQLSDRGPDYEFLTSFMIAVALNLDYDREGAPIHISRALVLPSPRIFDGIPLSDFVDALQGTTSLSIVRGLQFLRCYLCFLIDDVLLTTMCCKVPRAQACLCQHFCYLPLR